MPRQGRSELEERSTGGIDPITKSSIFSSATVFEGDMSTVSLNKLHGLLIEASNEYITIL